MTCPFSVLESMPGSWSPFDRGISKLTDTPTSDGIRYVLVGLFLAFLAGVELLLFTSSNPSSTASFTASSASAETKLPKESLKIRPNIGLRLELLSVRPPSVIRNLTILEVEAVAGFCCFITVHSIRIKLLFAFLSWFIALSCDVRFSVICLVRGRWWKQGRINTFLLTYKISRFNLIRRLYQSAPSAALSLQTKKCTPGFNAEIIPLFCLYLFIDFCH